MAADIVLASASPRRKQLLSIIVSKFKCVAANIDESVLQNESAKALVNRLSYAKAASVQSQFPTRLIIGSDTVISLDNQVLGKPNSYDDFICMMQGLSNRSHQVFTGVCVMLGNNKLSTVINTDVSMGAISESDALHYWQTSEPQDKAGGYAIQGIGGQFVKSINGSYSAVVGLPLFETKELIHKVQEI